MTLVALLISAHCAVVAGQNTVISGVTIKAPKGGYGVCIPKFARDVTIENTRLEVGK